MAAGRLKQEQRTTDVRPQPTVVFASVHGHAQAQVIAHQVTKPVAS